MNRQNFPESEQYPQRTADLIAELGYAVGAIFGAGCFGALLAYVVLAFK